MTGQVVREPLREVGTDVAATGQYLPHRGDKFFGCARLGHIAGRSSLYHPDAILTLVEHTENQNREIRPFRVNALQEVEPIPVR